MIENLLRVVVIILAVFTFLPVSRCEVWWVRSLDFPRFQLAVIALVLIIAELIFLDFVLFSTWCVLVMTIVCFIYQVWWILPYTFFYPTEVEPSSSQDEAQRIRIITANVLTPNHNAEALLKLVKKNDPDILVTLESDTWWQSKLDELQGEYPHTIKCPLDNLYGMHVYSKLRLANSRIEFLVEKNIPSMHTLVSLPSGQEIRVHILHPAPPSPTQNEDSKNRDAELILVAGSVEHADVPMIVTGDLNDVAWSETTRLFRKISGLLDPRVGRGMYNTFHAKHWFMRWPLDHLFHSSHFTLSKIERLAGFGSDHFALFTELFYESEQVDNQSHLEVETEDRQWAKKKRTAADENIKDVPEPEDS